MNYNLGTLECCECNIPFSCRIGQSNQFEAKYHLVCKKCEAESYITLRADSSENINLEYDGVDKSDKTPNYHLDLHLDFPVKFYDEHPIISPFMFATITYGNERILEHGQNIHQLQELVSFKREIFLLMRYYKNNKWNNFTKTYKKITGADISSHINNQSSMDDALYKIFMTIAQPFLDYSQAETMFNEYFQITETVDSDLKIRLKTFITELSINTNMNKSFIDSIKIYQDILEKETILRPALLFDESHIFNREYLAFRVSHQDFEFIKELYKNICELISRQLTLIAGINNILHRGNSDNFLVTTNRNEREIQPRNLNRYSKDIPLAKKLQWIDNSWLTINSNTIDNKLRNAIAHFDYEYEDFSQKIKYKDGTTIATISLIEFCYRCIDAFRLMHILNSITHISKNILDD